MDERDEVLLELKKAVDEFIKNDLAYLLIPEIRTNIGYAIKDSKDVNDVAAIPGRLTVAFKRVIYCMPPAFGASDHIARVILETMKYNKEYRSAINLKLYSIFKESLSNVYIFDRKKEPDASKEKEHRTMNFMIKSAYEELGKIPNYIIDLGDYGKEPGLFIIDKNPLLVIDKALKLLDLIKDSE